MKLTKHERAIFEKYFKIYKDKNYIELENWTNGGVDMIITLYKDINTSATSQFIEYIKNFNIDEEILLLMQDQSYRNHFTIKNSLIDFEDWIAELKKIEFELLEIK